MTEKVYRKTATITAEQFDGSDEMVKKYGLIGIVLGMEMTPNGPDEIDSWGIKTLEGVMAVGDDDYIATGVNGEHWVIQREIFEKTYEEVSQ